MGKEDISTPEPEPRGPEHRGNQSHARIAEHDDVKGLPIGAGAHRSNRPDESGAGNSGDGGRQRECDGQSCESLIERSLPGFLGDDCHGDASLGELADQVQTKNLDAVNRLRAPGFEKALLDDQEGRLSRCRSLHGMLENRRAYRKGAGARTGAWAAASGSSG